MKRARGFALKKRKLERELLKKSQRIDQLNDEILNLSSQKPHNSQEEIPKQPKLAVENKGEVSQQIPKAVLEIVSRINEIVYIQSSHDYACLYGYDNTNTINEYYITLKKLANCFSKQLIKVNRSTLVNMNEVDSVRIESKKILIRFKGEFSEKFECSLTKGNLPRFRQKFPNFPELKNL